ncbi:hypothetical protein F5Y16DRAFT_398022 [Xylariaceae sp. FL0255]|nr:hypothetical protein F5Y16DRAFT_398022 [Xylariaceae sp. FL0255]
MPPQKRGLSKTPNASALPARHNHRSYESTTRLLAAVLGSLPKGTKLDYVGRVLFASTIDHLSLPIAAMARLVGRGTTKDMVDWRLRPIKQLAKLQVAAVENGEDPGELPIERQAIGNLFGSDMTAAAAEHRFRPLKQLSKLQIEAFEAGRDPAALPTDPREIQKLHGGSTPKGIEKRLGDLRTMGNEMKDLVKRGGDPTQVDVGVAREDQVQNTATATADEDVTVTKSLPVSVRKRKSGAADDDEGSLKSAPKVITIDDDADNGPEYDEPVTKPIKRAKVSTLASQPDRGPGSFGGSSFVSNSPFANADNEAKNLASTTDGAGFSFEDEQRFLLENGILAPYSLLPRTEEEVAKTAWYAANGLNDTSHLALHPTIAPKTIAPHQMHLDYSRVVKYPSAFEHLTLPVMPNAADDAEFAEVTRIRDNLANLTATAGRLAASAGPSLSFAPEPKKSEYDMGNFGAEDDGTSRNLFCLTDEQKDDLFSSTLMDWGSDSDVQDGAQARARAFAPAGAQGNGKADAKANPKANRKVNPLEPDPIVIKVFGPKGQTFTDGEDDRDIDYIPIGMSENLYPDNRTPSNVNTTYEFCATEEEDTRIQLPAADGSKLDPNRFARYHLNAEQVNRYDRLAQWPYKPYTPKLPTYNEDPMMEKPPYNEHYASGNGSMYKHPHPSKTEHGRLWEKKSIEWDEALAAKFKEQDAERQAKEARERAEKKAAKEANQHAVKHGKKQAKPMTKEQIRQLQRELEKRRPGHLPSWPDNDKF